MENLFDRWEMPRLVQNIFSLTCGRASGRAGDRVSSVTLPFGAANLITLVRRLRRSFPLSICGLFAMPNRDFGTSVRPSSAPSNPAFNDANAVDDDDDDDAESERVHCRTNERTHGHPSSADLK